jgi:arylsulfatase A-like enzyme
VFIQAQPLAGKLRTAEPILLDDDYVLEFIALASHDKIQPPLVLKTYIEVDGREILLASNTAHAFDKSSIRNEEGIKILDEVVRVDLEAYRGQRVRFRWVLGDGSSRAEGAIGSIKLRASDSQAHSQPDVLLICSDTHRYDFSVSGEGKTLMPRLQRLMNNSIVYHRAFSNATWTMPSITSTMTGLFPRYHRTGHVTESVDAKDFDANHIPQGQFAFKTGETYRFMSAYSSQLRSLPETLRRFGYNTALIAANALYVLSGLAYDGNDTFVDARSLNGQRINDVARELIEHTPSAEPLFLTVHYIDVHNWQPWYFRKQHPNLKAGRKSREQVLESYGRAVEDSDHLLSSLLDTWAANRDLDNTLIVFYSDHGEHLTDPKLGHGNSMHDVLLQVPLVVKLPRSISAVPTIVNYNVSLADIPPSVLDILDIPYESESFSGRSVMKLDTDVDAESRSLFADYQLYGDSLSSVRRGPFKLIINFDKPKHALRKFGSERLAATGDSLELKTKAELTRTFEDYRTQAEMATEDLSPAGRIDHKEAIDALRSLGYVK